MIETLRQYETENKIYSQKHPELPLLVWNYTKNTAYNNLWDDITIMCRCLVTDLEGNIVARSFPKFWNLEEERHVASERFSIYKKYDGSLGLLFWYKDNWVFCSRGSFTSDQAIKGWELISKYDLDSLNKEYGYSFEIIYPENQIVISYNFEDVILLAAINKKGNELDIQTISGFTIAEKYSFKDYTNLQIPDNEEGYIIHFDNGQRIKIKGETYKRLHSLLSNISTTSIWMCLNNGDPVESILGDLPDESYDKVNNYIDFMYSQFNKKKSQYIDQYNLLPKVDLDKDFADSVKENNLKHVFFRLRKNQSIDSIVWDNIKPAFKRIGGMSTHRITVLIGISGSGKSTWANSEWKKDPVNTVIINRDKIRELISGFSEEEIYQWYSLPERSKLEKEVTKYEMVLIQDALSSGKHIILDATHLEEKYITDVHYWNVPVNLKWFNCPLELAVERNSKRTRKVSEDVIKSQFERLNKLKQDYTWTNPITKLDNDKSRPVCYIVDIDGTIADNSHRSPFDWSKVKDDKPITWVIDIINKLDNVIICTGRDGSCKEDTIEWLKSNGIKYIDFHIRDTGNTQPDWVVKEKMWREITTNYYIAGMFDDRTQVIRRARALDLNVLEVNYHNF